MGLMIKMILAAFWLLVVPAAAGAPFFQKKEIYSVRNCFLTGYAFLFAVMEVLTLLMIWLGLPLHILWKPGDHNGMVGDVVSAEKGCNRCIYGKAEKRENPSFYSYDPGIGFDSAADVCGSALCTYGCR